MKRTRGITQLFLLIFMLLAACTPAANITPGATAVVSAPRATPTASPIASITPAANQVDRPAATMTPTPARTACGQTRGTLETVTLNSAMLSEPFVTTLYLPPCFDPATARAQPYPLLVLLHGQAADAEEWQRLGIPATADRLIAAGAIPPLLIAMPYERQSLKDPFESSFDDALLEELLPHLEENYAACRERACRALGGLSRGAAWALYIGLSHPDVFAALGAHSYPAFYGDFNRLPLLLREIEDGQIARIWMDTGERDRYRAQAEQYHELLEQHNVPHEWCLFPGEHDEVYWSAHVEDYLRWYGGMLN